ncbi:LysE family translocator [Kushneria aurantia]|uniref:LysE family translocator n=1 Tax=Kushneria aurantia TaxID=504092 RepID=A0ABV6FZ79_9GAMM
MTGRFTFRVCRDLGNLHCERFFSVISLLGLASILKAFPSFTEISVILGSAYLTYIAYTIFSSTVGIKKTGVKGGDISEGMSFGFTESYRVGALINLFNIKTIAFMISIFSGFLATPRSLYEQSLIVIVCSTLEFLWYFLVAFVFGKTSVRNIFLRHRIAIDRSLAMFLVLFAMQNIYQIM